MNHYGYCWGNPVGLVDLDGNMPLWLEGVFAHMAIESDVSAKYSNNGTNVQTNVFIPGGGEGRTQSGNGVADIVMKTGSTYNVYEIKPSRQDNGNMFDPKNMTLGQIQLTGYVNGINNNIAAGVATVATLSIMADNTKRVLNTMFGAFKNFGNTLFGMGEILLGGLCYLGAGALVLDDVSGIGILDDGVAVSALTGGKLLIADGYRRIANSATGCGLE